MASKPQTTTNTQDVTGKLAGLPPSYVPPPRQNQQQHPEQKVQSDTSNSNSNSHNQDAKKRIPMTIYTPPHRHGGTQTNYAPNNQQVYQQGRGGNYYPQRGTTHPGYVHSQHSYTNTPYQQNANYSQQAGLSPQKNGNIGQNQSYPTLTIRYDGTSRTVAQPVPIFIPPQGTPTHTPASLPPPKKIPIINPKTGDVIKTGQEKTHPVEESKERVESKAVPQPKIEVPEKKLQAVEHIKAQSPKDEPKIEKKKIQETKEENKVEKKDEQRKEDKKEVEKIVEQKKAEKVDEQKKVEKKDEPKAEKKKIQETKEENKVEKKGEQKKEDKKEVEKIVDQKKAEKKEKKEKDEKKPAANTTSTPAKAEVKEDPATRRANKKLLSQQQREKEEEDLLLKAAAAKKPPPKKEQPKGKVQPQPQLSKSSTKKAKKLAQAKNESKATEKADEKKEKGVEKNVEEKNEEKTDEKVEKKSEEKVEEKEKDSAPVEVTISEPVNAESKPSDEPQEEGDWEKEDIEEKIQEIKQCKKEHSSDYQIVKKRFARELILQYQNVCTEIPEDFPSLEKIIPFTKPSRPANSYNSSSPHSSYNQSSPNFQGGRYNNNYSSFNQSYPNSQAQGEFGVGRGFSRSGSFPTRGGGRGRPFDPTRGGYPQRQVIQRKQHEIFKNTDETTRKATGLLNKMTLENFDSISKQIIELIMSDIQNAGNNEGKSADTQTTLNTIVRLIFEKAVIEQNFCTMYASLCVKISQMGADVMKKLKAALIGKCQSEFEDRAKSAQALKESLIGVTDEYEIGEKQFKHKRRLLGNIKLIGELYKERFISMNIIGFIFNSLLNAGFVDLDFSKEDINLPSTEEIECTVRLMTTIGKQIDSTNKDDVTKIWMQGLFKAFKKLAKSNHYDTRCRYMVLDLVELRQNKWIPRIEKDGPKTIKEIHQQAEENQNLSANPKKLYNSGNNISNGRDSNKDKFQKQVSKSGASYKNQSQKRDSSSKTKVQNPYYAISEFDPKKSEKRTNQENSKQKKKAQEPAAQKSLSKEEAEKKFSSILEELLSSGEVEEAVECVRELKAPPEFNKDLLNVCINLGLERKQDARKLLNELLVQLGGQGIFSPIDFYGGFDIFFEYLEDMIVDIPTLPTDVGITLGNLISEDVIAISSISKHSEKVKETRTGDKFLDSIFSTIKSKKGQEFLTDKLEAAGLRVESYMKEEDASKLLVKYNL